MGKRYVCLSCSIKLHNCSAKIYNPLFWVQTRKHVSWEEIKPQLDNTIEDAAANLGVCVTFLQLLCRQHGIPRWPQRSRNSLQRLVKEAEVSGYMGILHDHDYARAPARRIILNGCAWHASLVADYDWISDTCMQACSHMMVDLPYQTFRIPACIAE
jgi:hypothetical protein